jgi:hypothetical protein
MERLGTDSGEYDILADAAWESRKVDGLSIEFGLREGGGSQHMIEALLDPAVGPRTHIAVDPYGGLPYEWKQDQIAGWTYDDRMRNDAVSKLLGMTAKGNVNFLFFNLTDEQFFDRFSDGVPVYQTGEERVISTYAIAHLDAVHSVEAISAQIEWLDPRMVAGSIIVIDDILDFYDTDEVEALLFEKGYTIFKKGTKKGAYVKG